MTSDEQEILTRHSSLVTCHFIYRPAAGLCPAVAALRVRVESIFVVNRDLLAGVYVAQGVKLYVAVEGFHVGVGFARMVDVVRAVPPATPIQTPARIYRTDAQDAAIGPAIRFCV